MELIKYQFKSFEKIPTKIWADSDAACIHIARIIALQIRQKQQEGEHIVLGLETGSSPIMIYKELVRMHKEEHLSFSNVITFNLDEYFPIQPDTLQSNVRYMREYLFDHIDIKPENIHIPDGSISLKDIPAYCKSFERKIESVGGIDIQLLGIGRSGRIGFNESGSREDSRMRLVRLDIFTRADAIKEFMSEQKVPYRAITMGIKNVLKARKIFIMAWGQHKAPIVKEAVEGPVSPQVPASYLQMHGNTQFFLDQAATEELTRFKTPWLAGMCNWSEDLICQAVVWLSQKVDKPILKLTAEDYFENGLSDLILELDSAYDINIKIFNRLQHTISGWPGGKPKADDTTRPERAKPGKKRVIIFSPHPDDDVISMGGTFLRLVDQGHEVHVAYQTSGNVAVHDHDALRFIEFLGDFSGVKHAGSQNEMEKYVNEMISFLKNKKGSHKDTDNVRLVKGLIRRGEASAGARFCGLPDEKIHFLDMPFYETGKAHKNPLGEADIQLTMDFIDSIKPHQVFAAGDLADPHGTHRICLDAVFIALERLKGRPWTKDCWLWLYRGAWHEWGIHEIEMAVPLSPDELVRKRRAIFMHQSQKDAPPFPGDDKREFWQRAEDRNRDTARIYRELGFAEYEAMEAFKRWIF